MRQMFVPIFWKSSVRLAGGGGPRTGCCGALWWRRKPPPSLPSAPHLQPQLAATRWLSRAEQWKRGGRERWEEKKVRGREQAQVLKEDFIFEAAKSQIQRKGCVMLYSSRVLSYRSDNNLSIPVCVWKQLGASDIIDKILKMFCVVAPPAKLHWLNRITIVYSCCVAYMQYSWYFCWSIIERTTSRTQSFLKFLFKPQPWKNKMKKQKNITGFWLEGIFELWPPWSHVPPTLIVCVFCCLHI